MNPISPQLATGTLAELLVQARLLQFDVQAAPPLKDSGNDLIAIRGRSVCSIQVKATHRDYFSPPQNSKEYDVLAAVHFVSEGRNVLFDQCEIFLLMKGELAGLPRGFSALPRHLLLSEERIDTLFRAINQRTD